MRKHVVTLIARDEHAPPIAPACVCGVGPAARALCARLLEDDDEALLHLDGVRTAESRAQPLVVVVRGPEARLPWVDGALYLGEHAPGLFAPTTMQLDAPASLVKDALARSVPLALLPGMRIPLKGAMPLSRELLAMIARSAA